jgi:hypothetical protein
MTFKSIGVSCVVLCVSAFLLSGCTEETTMEPELSWEGINGLVFAHEGFDTPFRDASLLAGQGAEAMIEAIGENTEVSHNLTQTQGGGTWVCALVYDSPDQEPTPKFAVMINFQYVEGMGDKNNHDPDRNAELLQGQGERSRRIREIATAVGADIPAEDFEKTFNEISRDDRYFLCWKK